MRMWGGRAAIPSGPEWVSIGEAYQWAPRELEAVRLVLSGTPRKSAAERLGISLSSLQTYLRRAMWKVDVDDVIALFWSVVAARDKLRNGRAGG